MRKPGGAVRDGPGAVGGGLGSKETLHAGPQWQHHGGAGFTGVHLSELTRLCFLMRELIVCHLPLNRADGYGNNKRLSNNGLVNSAIASQNAHDEMLQDKNRNLNSV